jgi:cyclomaltodextrinase
MQILRMKNLILALLIAPALASAKTPFLGAIPVQYISAGDQVIIDTHRFFQPADHEKLDFDPNPDVEVSIDAAAFQLRAQANKPGLFDVVLSVPTSHGKLSTILTLACGKGSAASQHFALKPAAAVPGGDLPAATHKVFLAGSFNGWNTTKMSMTGPNESGEYTIDLPLAPGHYSYKFLIDGKWTLDPTNPQTEDNGLGDKNSVVTVTPQKASNGPTIYADRAIDHKLFVRAVTDGTKLGKVSAIFEGDAGSTSVPAKIANDAIEVPLPQNKAGFVRVIAADDRDMPSNVVRYGVGPKAFHWQDGIMYYALTDRFADGDKSNDHPVDNSNVLAPANFHGGDLRGVRDHIDNGYFESLGVNTVWLGPLNRNPDKAYQEYPEPHRWYTGYHGYWPISPEELDPHIGTAKDLNDLVAHAHAHGMKVIADLVLHHVHELHPWWKQHRDWFGTLDLPDGRKNLRLWDEQQFTTWFEPYLPSFDFSKDAPVKALIDNSIWWANKYKLDGYRLDAVKHILPSFWWKFRAALRERVDRKGESPLYLVGETFKDRPGIMSFVGPNMLDGQFDFPLYDQIQETFGQAKGEIKALDDSLGASEKIYGKETLMSPLIGNHDKGRFMAYADGELPGPGGMKDEEVGWKDPPKVRDPGNYKKIELAQAFLMSIDGVPMVYYGDEIGMTGAGDPDNRRDMRFGDQVSRDEKGVLENFEKLGAIRNQHPALRYGSRRAVLATNEQYAFVRAHLDDRIAVVFNRARDDAKIEINVGPELADGDYTEALSGNKITVANGKLEFDLPGQTAAFISRTR